MKKVGSGNPTTAKPALALNDQMFNLIESIAGYDSWRPTILFRHAKKTGEFIGRNLWHRLAQRRLSLLRSSQVCQLLTWDRDDQEIFHLLLFFLRLLPSP